MAVWDVRQPGSPPRSLSRALGRTLGRVPPQASLTGLGCMAATASRAMWNHFPPSHYGDAVVGTMVFVELALGFVCFVAAALWRNDRPALVTRTLQLLIVPILIWAAMLAPRAVPILANGLTTTATVRPPSYGSDAMYYNHYDALLVLHGEDPYTGNRLADAIHYFHVPAYTPLARGRFSHVLHPPGGAYGAALRDYLAHPQEPPPEIDPRTLHSYPAGSFLVAIPVILAGLPNIAFAQIVLFVALGIALVAATPGWSRLTVGLLLLSGLDGLHQVAGGDFEIWTVALVAGAWLLCRRRVASGLLLGAACAIKQTAWLAVPFYLIWTWREKGRDEALRRAGIALGAFVAINLPWIIASPRAWFASLWLPIDLPLLPDGVGLVGLMLNGALPPLPSWLFGMLELTTLIGSMVWYWRMQSRYPFAGLVLALLPLLMAWRSSSRYFALLPVAGVVMLVLTLRQMRSAAEPARDATKPVSPGAAFVRRGVRAISHMIVTSLKPARNGASQSG